MISIDSLKHFAAVVECNGVNRAAEKIALSASALTRSIKGIEDQLGRRVFDRVGRKIVLNSAGQEFYERAMVLIRDFDALTTRSERHRFVGHYQIGASHFLCKSLIARKVAEVAGTYPFASFSLSSLDTSVLVRKLHRGDLDLGFCISPRVPETLSRTVVSTGTLYLCASRKHELAGLPFARIRAKLSELPAIMHRPTESVDRCDKHPMYERYGIKPKIQVYWDSDDVAVELLSSGQYWTMLPDIVLDRHPQLRKLAHPKEWVAPYEICLLRNRHRTSAELERLFVWK